MIDMNVVNHMALNNGQEYNFRKTAEELMELALVLLQTINKKQHGAPDEQEIIDEIGDVIIRLEVLKRLYSDEKINQRIKFKMDKFQAYIDTKKYRKF